jgi:hypothetical protein
MKNGRHPKSCEARWRLCAHHARDSCDSDGAMKIAKLMAAASARNAGDAEV